MSDHKPGERRDYRASPQAPLVRVEVIRELAHLGHTEVRFANGRVETVLTSTLFQPGEESEEFRRTQSWEVIEAGEPRREHEIRAAQVVFDTLIPSEIAELAASEFGVSIVHDAVALQELIGLPAERLASSEKAFFDGSSLVVPWATTREILVHSSHRSAAELAVLINRWRRRNSERHSGPLALWAQEAEGDDDDVLALVYAWSSEPFALLRPDRADDVLIEGSLRDIDDALARIRAHLGWTEIATQ